MNNRKNAQHQLDRQLENVRGKLKKWGDKKIYWGYTPEKEKYRKNGDRWTDVDGKEWVKENGMITSVDKYDKRSIVTPWWCPKCGNSIDGIHLKFYRLRGACHRCVVKYEHQIRKAGLWEAYERKLTRDNERAWLKDHLEGHLEYIREFKSPQLHFSDGRWEETADKKIFTEMLEKLEQDVEFIEQRLKFMDEEETNDDEQRRLDEWTSEHPWTTERVEELASG